MVLPASIFKMDGDTRSSSSNNDDDDENNEGSSSSDRLDTKIDVAKDPIVRGNRQSFSVIVSDRNNGDPVQGAQVDASVKYAGPHTEYFGSQTTGSSGSASFSWTIGGNSNPGTFTITVDVSESGYGSTTETSSFKVITKADEMPSILPSKELICDDGIDNDGDGLVDAGDPDCQLSIDPCIENPELPECQSIDPCENNPDLPECILPPIDPCEQDPETEGCEPEPEPPSDPCEENPDSEECDPGEPEPEPEPEPDPTSDEGDNNGAEDGDDINGDDE
jgi:hypothetical protein